MNKKNNIDQLFEKYKMKEPLPPEVRSRINKSKKKSLINILSQGKKNYFIIITVSVLLFMKKFGLNLTLLKSVILAGASAVIITGTAVVSTAAVYYKIFNPNDLKKPVMDVPEDITNTSGISTSTNEKSSADKTFAAPKVQIPFEVGIMYFYSDAKSSAFSSKIMAGVTQNLIKLRNPDFAGFVSDSKSSNKAKKILTGSVLKLDNNYKITLKLVDFKTTQILVYITETVEKEEDAARASESIAKKILDKM